jgi:hypothetical protein
VSLCLRRHLPWLICYVLPCLNWTIQRYYKNTTLPNQMAIHPRLWTGGALPYKPLQNGLQICRVFVSLKTLSTICGRNAKRCNAKRSGRVVYFPPPKGTAYFEAILRQWNTALIGRYAKGKDSCL